MTCILILALGIMLYISYRIFDKELCSPAILYITPFIAMAAVAFLFQWVWDMELHMNTVFVILTGTVFFIAGAYIGKRIRLTGTGNKCRIDYWMGIENWKYILFFLISLVSFGWRYKLVIDYGRAHGAKTISRALVYYNNMLKFTTNELLRTPRLVGIGNTIGTAAGFIWACDLANQLLRKDKNRLKIILSSSNLALCIIGSMSSGARGGAVQIISAFAIALLIMLYRRGEWKRLIPLKYILIICIVFLLTAAGFLGTVTLIGRYKVNAYASYIANYLGAQLYNLNHYLNEDFRTSGIFGQETFRSIIQFFAKAAGVSRYARYTSDLPSVLIGDLSLGNVYTCYYPYIHDFGFAGVMILSFIFGLASMICYRHARKSPSDNPIHLGLIIYGRMSYCLLFSYFSNKFYSIIVSANFVKQILYTVIMLYFLYGIRIRFRIRRRRHRYVNSLSQELGSSADFS